MQALRRRNSLAKSSHQLERRGARAVGVYGKEHGMKLFVPLFTSNNLRAKSKLLLCVAEIRPLEALNRMLNQGQYALENKRARELRAQ